MTWVGVLGLLLASLPVVAPAYARNAVTLTASADAVVGKPVTLTARVLPKRKGRTVVFQRSVDGRWKKIGTATTNRRGAARIKKTFTTAGRVTVRSIAQAHRGSKPTRDTTRFRVRRRPPIEQGGLAIEAPAQVEQGTQFDVRFVLAGPLSDATLTVAAPASGVQVMPPDDVAIDPDTHQGTVTVGDLAATATRTVTVRWQAPSVLDSLLFEASLAASGGTVTDEATVAVVGSGGGGGILFGPGLEAMTESRSAPMTPEMLFLFCWPLPSVAVPTYDVALGEAKTWLAGQIVAAYADDWNNHISQQDPELLDDAVGIAVAAGRPAAALAAALRAHELEPDNPLHLSNAAAAANMLEQPDWGVAFATQAGLATGPTPSVGVRQEAVRLTNLGHAWALMSQWGPAENALRAALAIDGQSQGVHAELAMVLGCQSKKDEALPHLRRSMRTSDAPDPIQDPPERGTSRFSNLDTSDLFTMTSGVTQDLGLPYLPPTMGEFVALARPVHGGNGYYWDDYWRSHDRLMELIDRRHVLEEDLREAQKAQQPVMVRRTDDLLRRVSAWYDQDLIDARTDLVEKSDALWGLNNCGGQHLTHPLCAVDGWQSSCAEDQAIFDSYEIRMEAYLSELMEYHTVAGNHYSDVQGLISDPIAHELAAVRAETEFAGLVSGVVQNLASMSNGLAQFNDSDVPDVDDVKKYCEGFESAPPPDPTVTDRQPAPFCTKDSLESKVNLTLNFEIVTFETSCENGASRCRSTCAGCRPSRSTKCPTPTTGPRSWSESRLASTTPASSPRSTSRPTARARSRTSAGRWGPS